MKLTRFDIPIERRAYKGVFAFWSVVLALSMLWAVVDETMTRRPWKEYQEQFNKLDFRMTSDALAAAEKKYDEKQQKLEAGNSPNSVKALQAKIDELRKPISGEAGKTLEKTLKDLTIKEKDATVRYNFSKSKYDAEYYTFKETQHAKENTAAVEARMAAFMKDMGVYSAQIDSADKAIAAASAERTAINAQCKVLLTKIDEASAEVVAVRRRLDGITKRSIAIKQVIVKNAERTNFGDPLDNVDRCQTCHQGANVDGFTADSIPKVFRTHPRKAELFKNHNPENVGCVFCHGGQGATTTAKDAHGDVEFSPEMLSGPQTEAKCRKCHMTNLELDGAPHLSAAKKAMVDAGCWGCHEIAGTEGLIKPGPDLGSIVKKVPPQWIFKWIKNPRSYLPNTTMPNFRLSDDEAKAIVAYVVSQSKDAPYNPLRSAAKGSPTNGKHLVETVGCKACHLVERSDKMLVSTTRLREANNFAPALYNTAAKNNPEWLFYWLKNPRLFRPDTKMPCLRLSDQEAADIVSYLVTLGDANYTKDAPDLSGIGDPKLIATGDKLIRTYGCFGCHTIKGMEKEGRVSVNLNNFAAKRPEELAFSDAIARGEVKAETWEAWFQGKMKNSRAYASEAIVQRMPDFAMNDSDAQMMTVFAKSLREDYFLPIYVEQMDGQRLDVEQGEYYIHQRNCKGCHLIDNKGGFIRSTFDNPGMAPPVLNREGDKAQEDWLLGFLKQPHTIRPWLNFRMPTFGFNDDQASIIIRYFLGRAKAPIQYKQYSQMELEPLAVADGKKLFETLKCQQCHTTGGKVDPSQAAPNLGMSKFRLKPKFIEDWLHDPQQIVKGTQMPSFFLGGDGSYPDVLGGKVDPQIHALQQYIYSIGTKPILNELPKCPVAPAMKAEASPAKAMQATSKGASTKAAPIKPAKAAPPKAKAPGKKADVGSTTAPMTLSDAAR